jgi:hypothetical protein
MKYSNYCNDYKLKNESAKNSLDCLNYCMNKINCNKIFSSKSKCYLIGVRFFLGSIRSFYN